MNHLPRPLAVSIRSLAAALLCTGAFAAEPRPLRVLFYDPQAAEQSKAGVLRIAMEQLGRDAIWFDYFTPSSGLNEKLAGRYDVAMALGGDASALLAVTKRVVMVKDSDSPAAIRSMILSTVDPAAKAEWEKFLAQREPEVREKNPLVANYEKRPEAITLQQPFNVKGAMERTQVPADLKLELYASDPEIGKPIAFAWDARGRLWVAATSDYPHGVTEDGVGHDKIIICEDTKGTGRADKFTVFADKLNLPTGIVFARHPRHARAGEQPAPRLRQLALRLRRLLGLQGHRRREAVRVCAGHVSLQARRIGARIPASVHEQLVGPRLQ
jgi:hypothetical protein